MAACADGAPNQAAAAELGVSRGTVAKWRSRFLKSRLEGLTDEPRPGRPRTVSDAKVEQVVTVALEMLKRIDACLRAKKAEADTGAQSAQLALGRYVAESMHGFNNALTAVLGNAELLQLDATKFPPEMQEEIEAIHSNALRLHEMMQRFSSLEAEIDAGRKQGKSEAAAAAQAYLSGT